MAMLRLTLAASVRTCGAALARDKDDELTLTFTNLPERWQMDVGVKDR
jgi:hypothetical protein